MHMHDTKSAASALGHADLSFASHVLGWRAEALGTPLACIEGLTQHTPT